MSVLEFRKLPQILKTVQDAHLTGVLLARANSSEQGAALVFREGHLIHAQMGTGEDRSEGDEALYSLLSWDDGRLKWQNGQPDVVPTVDSLQEESFLEAVDYLTKYGNLEADLPSNHSLNGFFGIAPLSASPVPQKATPLVPAMPEVIPEPPPVRPAALVRPYQISESIPTSIELETHPNVPLMPAEPAPLPMPSPLDTDSGPLTPAPGSIITPLRIGSRVPMNSVPTAPAPVEMGPTVATLVQMGVPHLQNTKQYSLNSHFCNVVQVAREIAGEYWPRLVQAAQLQQYLYEDPPNNEEYSTPLEYLSQLNFGFEQVFAQTAPEKIRQWGRMATERSIKLRKSSGREQGIIRLIPGKQRRITILLNSFTKTMDTVRGEHLHTWKQIDNNQFWLVNYANLYSLGRRRKRPSCYVWTASIGATIRWAGLDNDCFVEEIECGSVTGTYDCVFAIRLI